MKKLLFMLLAVVAFAGCSKEETPENVWDNVIKEIGHTELTPFEVLKSADAWRPVKIYKYYDAGGKNGGERYWDSDSGGKEIADGSFLYAVTENHRYALYSLNEYRIHPDDGQKFYYAHHIASMEGDQFKLQGPYGLNRDMTVVAYDENSMVLEFYDPGTKGRPYTRELIVRVNGAKDLNKHEDYTELYNEEGEPYQRFDWVIDHKFPTNIKQTMIETPYWASYALRRAYVRKSDDGITTTLYTTMSPENFPYDGGSNILFFQFGEDKYKAYYHNPIPNSKIGMYEGYMDQAYILQYKDVLLAFTFYSYDLLTPGEEIDVYFAKPSNQEAFDEMIQKYGFEE
ncbi:MAG: hypothetical protein IJD72_06195 [Alistipes sp.]|nr:hypothetical protein [Alistipes sp.]